MEKTSWKSVKRKIGEPQFKARQNNMDKSNENHLDRSSFSTVEELKHHLRNPCDYHKWLWEWLSEQP